MSSFIEIKNLYKSYGSLQAVSDISLDVPKGQILGMLGPNGAGKSTILRIITGFLEASSGEVAVGNYAVAEQSLKTRKLLGYLPESTPLYENMLVYDYLNFVGQAHDIPKNERFKKIRKAAESCDILEFSHRPIGELSKGQRQRVGLAMAILDDPEVLILDEPTSGLDPNQIISIRKIIKELGREKTVIFSTHILSEAEATCDRVVIINKGKIVADGSIAELKKSEQSRLCIRLESNDATAVQRAFDSIDKNLLGRGAKIECQNESPNESQGELQDGDSGEILVTLQGEGSGSNEIKQCIKAIMRDNNWFMLGMEHKSHSLEDIFRELTS